MSSTLPHWILENVIAVEDVYLMPKPRLQVVGHTTQLSILPKVMEKWSAFVERHRLKEKGRSCDINHYLQLIEPEQLTNVQRWAFASVLGIKTTSYVEIGMAWIERHTSVFFIFADTHLIEFVTFRGMRQIRKKAGHCAKECLAGMPEAQRIHTISKYKRQFKIQGGLVKQERQPRDRWRSSKTTY